MGQNIITVFFLPIWKLICWRASYLLEDVLLLNTEEMENTLKSVLPSLVV